MRLKMNKDGEVVQVDSRFNDDRGVGRTARLVDEDNVANLSVGKTRQAVFDQMKAREMSRIGQQNFKKQELIKEYKTRIKRNLQEIGKIKAQKIREMSNNKRAEAANSLKLRAIKQSAANFEKMGVSGSGLTPTGAKPFPTFPGRDYHIMESAPNDFGGMGDMGIMRGSMPSEYKAPPVRVLPASLPPTYDSVYKDMKAMETPIKGGFTSFHKFIIGVWEKNSYVVKQYRGERKKDETGAYLRDLKRNYVYDYNYNTTPSDSIINLNAKRAIWDFIESIRLGNRDEGQKEMLASSMRGWMWSG